MISDSTPTVIHTPVGSKCTFRSAEARLPKWTRCSCVGVPEARRGGRRKPFNLGQAPWISRLEFPSPNAQRWSPESPHLEELELENHSKSRVLDRVPARAAFREIQPAAINSA